MSKQETAQTNSFSSTNNSKSPTLSSSLPSRQNQSQTNTTGYTRVILAILSFAIAFDQSHWFCLFYLTSFLLDAADGYFARLLNQCNFFFLSLTLIFCLCLNSIPFHLPLFFFQQHNNECISIFFFPQWTNFLMILIFRNLCCFFPNNHNSRFQQVHVLAQFSTWSPIDLPLQLSS